MAFAATPAWSNTQLIGTGSGVVVGPHEILTADHVIKNCTRISTSSPFTASLTVKTSNADKDLAILYVESAIPDSSIVRLRDESKPPNVRIGDQVIATGYPKPQLMASSLNLTTGNISAMAGFKNDPNSYTFTAPIQPGNSGGPLLDDSGNLIGIVTSKINVTIAENVFFAIKGEVIKHFLYPSVSYQIASSTTKMTPADVGEKAKLFTVKIDCYGEAEVAQTPPSSPTPPSSLAIPMPPIAPPEPLLPACNSEAVFDVLRNIAITSYRVVLYSIYAEEIMGNSNDRKFCHAMIQSSAGKRSIGFFITWLNPATGSMAGSGHRLLRAVVVSNANAKEGRAVGDPLSSAYGGTDLSSNKTRPARANAQPPPQRL